MIQKPPAVVVGLKTLKIKGKSLPTRANKKRVFTEDEWKFLNSLPTDDLARRIQQGEFLIRLLHSPQMVNMSSGEADRVSSNLRFQIEAIQSIIDSRPKEILNG